MPTNKELFTSSMNSLNDVINSKAGTTGKHTIDQMTTVANSIVTGKTEQTKYVTLDMSSGDQYISPDTNKTMSLVTVEKPSTLVASNIKKDVNIGGIVGTYEGSGGGNGHTLTITEFQSGTWGSYLDTTGTKHTISKAGTYNNVVACFGDFFYGYDEQKVFVSYDDENESLYMILLDDITARIVRGYSVTFENNRLFRLYDGMDPTGKFLGYGGSHGRTYRIISGYVYMEGEGVNFYNAATVTGGVSLVSQVGYDILYRVTGSGTIKNAFCYCMAKGTKITMADGSTKNIEDVTYDDELLVWNFYEGKLDKSKPIWIVGGDVTSFYYLTTLEDGTQLKLVGPYGHRLYNVDKQEMTYCTEMVGDYTINQQCEKVKVISCEKIDEPVEFYNIITKDHYNLYANNILTSCRLSNRYVIENMKYTNEVRITEQEVNEYLKEHGI